MSDTEKENEVNPEIMNGAAQGSGMEKTLMDAEKRNRVPGTVPSHNGGSTMENVMADVYSGC